MRTQGPKPQGWREVAAAQRGLITRRELMDKGLSAGAITRLLNKGELLPLYRGIYLIGGNPVTWETRLVAATFLGRGFASHRSAARSWDLSQSNVIEVTTSRRPKDPAVTWHRRTLSRSDCTHVDGIPVTSIHRTLIDLGDVVADDVVEDALDRALERGLTSANWLRSEIERVGTKGRRGPCVLRDILEKGQEKASWLERRFVRRLGRGSLPPYFREFPVATYYIDFAWPEVLLGVEVHGGKWHKRRARWAKDLARHNELTALGWTILHFTWEEIRDNADVVLAEIATTYERLALCLGLNAR